MQRGRRASPLAARGALAAEQRRKRLSIRWRFISKFNALAATAVLAWPLSKPARYSLKFISAALHSVCEIMKLGLSH